MILNTIFSIFLTFSLINPPVVGGEDAQDGEFPYLSSLVIQWVDNARDGHFCGGTLIYPNWVVTAAHCIEEQYPTDVILDRANLQDSRGERISVIGFYSHPDYDRNTLGADIALLKLEKASSVYPIKGIITSNLQLEYTAAGVNTQVVGWGNSSAYSEIFLNQLQKTDIPIVSTSECSSLIGVPTTYLTDKICVGYPQGGKSGCHGDSGGPLLIDVEGDNFVAGVASYVAPNGCGEYTLYTRIAPYMTWIDETIQNNGGITPVARYDCWDLNEDDICQDDEDKNGDGFCDVYDCQGAEGYSTLFNIVDEPEGENCEAGGQKIEYGLDLDRDHTLDSDEITESKYICNGVSGSDGADGGCSFGTKSNFNFFHIFILILSLILIIKRKNISV